MRRGPVFVATSVACVTLLAALVPPRPRLIWNASASVPLGLYAVAPAEKLHRGELAVVDPPPEIADLFAERGYLPRGVPLLKFVRRPPDSGFAGWIYVSRSTAGPSAWHGNMTAKAAPSLSGRAVIGSPDTSFS
jgi:type IV secretory pathway protease TraF